MKRLLIALAVIVALGIISPALTSLAQPLRVPHENPATATGSLDNAALLLSYSKIYTLIAGRQYQTAQDIITALQQTDIPAELSYITERYETICQQVLDNLNNTEFLLNEASSLFSLNQIADAKKKLDEADISIHDTESLLVDIEAATMTLGDELGVFAALAPHRIKQAYDRLSISINSVRLLTNELELLRERLNENPQTVVAASFYQLTTFDLSVPDTAYPGLPVTVSGQVRSGGVNIPRTIMILLDDIRLAEENVPGQFSLEVTPPEQISTGEHNLTVSVASQGRYSGAHESRAINISRLPIYIDIQTPKFFILPQTIRFNGKIYGGPSPVPYARVKLAFKDSFLSTITSSDGSFTMSMEAPLDLSFISNQESIITIEPVEPWYASLKVKRQLFTMNPLSTGLILAILIALGILAYRGRQTRARVPAGIPQTEVIEPTAITLAPQPKPRPTRIKGRILSAYRSGLEAVEKISGINMAPHITLREFLKMTTLPTPTATEQFAELTLITESALYSAYSPEEDTASRAEELAATIKEVLRRGTT